VGPTITKVQFGTRVIKNVFLLGYRLTVVSFRFHNAGGGIGCNGYRDVMSGEWLRFSFALPTNFSLPNEILTRVMPVKFFNHHMCAACRYSIGDSPTKKSAMVFVVTSKSVIIRHLIGIIIGLKNLSGWDLLVDFEVNRNPLV